jgi:hypothetical protein
MTARRRRAPARPQDFGADDDGRNGFIGFWLPKGASGTVEVTSGRGTGSQRFSTGVDDPTCMTTLRLA